MTKGSSAFTFALFVMIALSGCGHRTQTIVSGSKTSPSVVKPSVAPGHPSVRSITAAITVNKAAILNGEYFYGLDLQYSSIYQKSHDYYNQSLTGAHIPVFFRANGQELQLVADNSAFFQGNVNHPEQIVARYRIISETTESYTLSEADSAAHISSTIDPTLSVPRDHWARSFQFVPTGNYLLQESSVTLSDGSTVEVMESVFPRETLTASSSFQKLLMDPSVDAGASSGPAARFRFLMSKPFYQGDGKIAFAEHFDLGQASTIDWYVTDSIADADLPVVKAGVEAWNRYFKIFKGINRPVLQFLGKLPPNIKIGDPRFNVINWDTRNAGSTSYESQASDPFTGKQSHSLIYMPMVWYQKGAEYWKGGHYSEIQPSPNLSTGHAKQTPLYPGYRARCLREVSDISGYLNSPLANSADPNAFSTELMKQTIFHEVGHALGLDHNFKGSLSYDRSDAKSLFSSSMMDYNDYEIERAAFTTTQGSDGPVLEYDRQALSTLYNKMADVKDSDPLLPACNDKESDSESTGAVDPLCIRYDIEKDPTLSVTTAFSRVANETLANDTTLTQALLAVEANVLTESALKSAQTFDQQSALLDQYNNAVTGVLNFYFMNGYASISKTVRANQKSLYVFEDQILPDGYTEKAMRDRAYTGVASALSLAEFPAPVTGALAKLANEGSKLLATTPYAQSLSAADLATLSGEMNAQITEVASDYIGAADFGFSRMRFLVLQTLARVETLPLFYGTLSGTTVDYEKNLVSLIYPFVVDVTKSASERKAATSALASYRGRGTANALIDKARDKLSSEIATASDNASRELAQNLLDACK